MLEFNKHLALALKEMSRMTWCLANDRDHYRAHTKEKKLSERGGEEWDFIGSPPEYIEDLTNIINHEKLPMRSKFLDLGCGVSPILMYLNSYGYYNLFGVDNEEKYLNLIRAYLGTTSERFECCDLMKPSSNMISFINKADLIYMYQPIATRDLFQELLEQVWTQMSPGSLLVSYYGVLVSKLSFKDSRLTVPDTNSWYFKKPK